MLVVKLVGHASLAFDTREGSIPTRSSNASQTRVSLLLPDFADQSPVPPSLQIWGDELLWSRFERDAM